MISARCVAPDLHTVAPGPLERTCWRRFAALWRDCKKSRIAPLNAIIIIIIIRKPFYSTANKRHEESLLEVKKFLYERSSGMSNTASHRIYLDRVLDMAMAHRRLTIAVLPEPQASFIRVFIEIWPNMKSGWQKTQQDGCQKFWRWSRDAHNWSCSEKIYDGLKLIHKIELAVLLLLTTLEFVTSQQNE